MVEPLLKVAGLTKRFGGVVASDGIVLDVRPGELHAIIGPNASGKSTLARTLAEREHAMLFVQDDWVDALYPGAVVNVATYLEYSGRINRLLAPYVVDLLQRGVSVVMDFPGNTRSQRAWFRDIIDRAGVEHELHFVSNDYVRTLLKENMP